MINKNNLNALRAALAEALDELKQAGDTSERGVERQWVLLVAIKVQAAADLAEGVEPVEQVETVEPVNG